jgi:hypothetical protein
MDKMQTKRYGHLYDMVGQLQQLLEPDFMKEITSLETDISSARMDIRRLSQENECLADALLSIIKDVEDMLGRIWTDMDPPPFKSISMLLSVWPDEHPSIHRVATIINQASLVAARARVRSSMITLLKHGSETTRECHDPHRF